MAYWVIHNKERPVKQGGSYPAYKFHTVKDARQTRSGAGKGFVLAKTIK